MKIVYCEDNFQCQCDGQRFFVDFTSDEWKYYKDDIFYLGIKTWLIKTGFIKLRYW